MDREAQGGFAIHRGEIDGRLDPHFYFAEFTAAVARVQRTGNWRRLGQTVTLSDETRDPRAQDAPTFRYVEIGAIGIGSKDYEAAEVAREEAPSRARMLLRDGDILLSTTRPDRGAIVRVRSEDDGAIASTGFAVLRTPSKTIRDIVFEVLHTENVRLQLRQRSSGGAYPAITGEQLEQIVIPFIDARVHGPLVEDLDRARTRMTEDLRAADDFMAGIDAFVLSSLGLNIPAPRPIEGGFAVRVSNLLGARIDTEYHSPRFNHLRDMIEAGQWEVCTLAGLCEPLVTGFAAGAGDQASEADGVPHLRPTNVTAQGELSLAGSKFVPAGDVDPKYLARLGDILFNNTNSATWVGKSAVFELAVDCAYSNHMTRLRLSDGANSPIFYAALLNALRSTGYFTALSTNFNNQAGINIDVLNTLRLPKPPALEQQAIATEIRRRRAEARDLRQVARERWTQARLAFETALLGLEP